MLMSIGQNVVEQAVAEFRSKRGVSCFAEVPDNLLMWSHYSDHHKGFCLEFRTDLDPFPKAFKVKYSARMPAFDLEPMLCSKDFDQVLDLFCTKSIDWQYEREWRCIHNEVGTAYTYETEALTGVYFGPEAAFSSIEIIALILAGQNTQVKFWRGQRSKSDFTVDFEQVTYTPHLEAKRLGLHRDVDA